MKTRYSNELIRELILVAGGAGLLAAAVSLLAPATVAAQPVPTQQGGGQGAGHGGLPSRGPAASPASAPGSDRAGRSDERRGSWGDRGGYRGREDLSDRYARNSNRYAPEQRGERRGDFAHGDRVRSEPQRGPDARGNDGRGNDARGNDGRGRFDRDLPQGRDYRGWASRGHDDRGRDGYGPERGRERGWERGWQRGPAPHVAVAPGWAYRAYAPYAVAPRVFVAPTYYGWAVAAGNVVIVPARPAPVYAGWAYAPHR